MYVSFRISPRVSLVPWFGTHFHKETKAIR